MKTKEDISYGIVPLFKEGEDYQVLVVHQISYRGDDFWILPKGHAELGESPADTARRELAEETGVSEVITEAEPTFSIDYTFTHKNTKIHKTVQYFIGFCATKQTHITQPEEIKDLRWCSFKEAEELLTHQNSKNILEQVRQTLTNPT